VTEQPFSPFVGQILAASAALTADTTNRLIDSLTAQLAQKEAELAAVRGSVAGLLNDPWTPTTSAIRAALYPSAEVVAQYRRDGAEVSS
jgi:hypothetical protein